MAARADRPLAVALAWIEAHCVVPDREEVGQPFRLFDEQFRFLAAHYLVRGGARVGELGPAFVYRRSQLVAPQKAGKSPLEAAQVCLEGVGPALFAGWARGGETYDCRSFGCGCTFVYVYEPGEPMGRPWSTPLIQITASSVEQTENIYDALRPMIELGPLADLIPKTGEEFIRLPNGGRVDVVTSSAKSRLGQRVTFVPQDETGTWTVHTGMVKVAETQRRGLAGMGGRAVEITNAWDPAEQSVAQRTAESRAQDIYRQHVKPPAHLSYTDKRERHTIHRHVYKGWWGEQNLASIEAEAAELLEKDPEQAERFFGNRVVQGAGSYYQTGEWEQFEQVREVEPGEAVCFGFDGSDSDDWTAIRLECQDGYRFTPLYGPDRRPAVWVPAEWGGQVPRHEVMAAVEEIATTYAVRLAYCDPPDWWSEIGDWSAKYGEKVFLEWWTNRIPQMHEALQQSLLDYRTGRSTHDACPHAALCAENARKLARPGQRYILGKPNQHQKIDVTMADVLAHKAAADAHASPDGWTGAKPRTNAAYFR